MPKMLLAALLVLLALQCVAKPMEMPHTSLDQLISKEEFEKTTQKIITKHKGCVTDVCFLIDGSKSIPAYDYSVQIHFTKVAAYLLKHTSEKTRFAALQYGGTPADVLSTLTTDLHAFTKAVSLAPSNRYNVTNMGPSLLYCNGMLAKGRAKKRHIIVLGDGRTTFGPDDGPLGPVALGGAFRSRGGSTMTAVAVGFADIDELGRIVGGRQRVLETRWWGPKILRSAFMPLMDMICA